MVLDTYKKEVRPLPRRSLRSQRGGKLYGAAFPSLDCLVLDRVWAKGRSCCQWTNEAGIVVGHVALNALTADTLVMTTRLLGAINVGYCFGVDRLTLRRKRHNPAHDRPSFACPWCGRSARFVYAVTGSWAWRLCHDLVSVQRLLGPITKHQRRLAELQVLVMRGRPHYGRQARFDQQAAEYGRLLREFSHAPPLPRELGFAQYAEWLRPDDPRLKQGVE